MIDDASDPPPGEPMLVDDKLGLYTVRPTQRPRRGLVRCEVVHVLEFGDTCELAPGDVLLIPAAELTQPCGRGRLGEQDAA
jgi:hypothetical protein